VDELRTDVSRLELSIGAAKAEYDKIKAANVAETARFAAERRAEYSAMLENFTATQVWQWGFIGHHVNSCAISSVHSCSRGYHYTGAAVSSTFRGTFGQVDAVSPA
jgi:hypothetical protein